MSSWSFFSPPSECFPKKKKKLLGYALDWHVGGMSPPPVCALTSHMWADGRPALGRTSVSAASSRHLMLSILRRAAMWKWLSCLACLTHHPHLTGTQKENGSHSSADLQFCCWVDSSSTAHRKHSLALVQFNSVSAVTAWDTSSQGHSSGLNCLSIVIVVSLCVA